MWCLSDIPDLSKDMKHAAEHASLELGGDIGIVYIHSVVSKESAEWKGVNTSRFLLIFEDDLVFLRHEVSLL